MIEWMESGQPKLEFPINVKPQVSYLKKKKKNWSNNMYFTEGED